MSAKLPLNQKALDAAIVVGSNMAGEDLVRDIVTEYLTVSGLASPAAMSADTAPAAMPGEIGPDDAPCYLSAAEASAWASGFNAAHDALAPILAEKEAHIAMLQAMVSDSLWSKRQALEARALAAEAALAATKEASRQTVVAFVEELALRGVDQDMMADAMEALADRSDIAVAEARAAAIRAQGE